MSSVTPICSVLLDKDAIIVWADSPVLGVVVIIGVVLFVIGEEPIELDALLKVLYSFEASDVLKEIKISIYIDASSDESVPVNALKFDVRVVLLEFEINGFAKVNIWSLNCMHVFTCHFELVEIEVFWKYLHLYYKQICDI